jgi:cell division cycle 14
MILGAAIADTVYIAQGVDYLPQDGKFICFRPERLAYYPFCDDFGPMNLSSIVNFIEQLEHEISQNPGSRIVYIVEAGRRILTNAVFLLGAYMILTLGMKAQEVSDNLDWIDESSIEHYRDATFTSGSFRLTLEDCWRGLERGQALGWVQAGVDGEHWGMVNIDEYRHYDSPCNGDFHEVVPGKFIAFKGPKALGEHDFEDDESGCRVFSPSALADIFAEDFGVAAVVRLNEAEYDGAAFEARGIRHHCLEFEDCSCPPHRVAAAFLAVADAAVAAGRAVAVHCRAGLGRTGTLIALWLMTREGFGAREAMGWLRIMRPGSVIGLQQHYLCAVEAARAAGRAWPWEEAAAAGARADEEWGACGGEGAAGGAGLGEVVAAGMRRREGARRAAVGGGGLGEGEGGECVDEAPQN